MTIDQATLKDLLSYDKDCGCFHWLSKRMHGKQAGTKTSDGCIQISINQKTYLAHRLAWIYMFNECPPDQIEHINGIKSDNRIENLRRLSYDLCEKSSMIDQRKTIDVEKLNDLEWQRIFIDAFRYEEGKLYWNRKVSDKVVLGSRAGDDIQYGKSSVEKRRRIRIYNKTWQEHRVIFLMFNGYLPDQVDHIDCNPMNNKIENLRAATCGENSRNKHILDSNKSGHKNVAWDKERQKWKVEIRKDNKSHHIGRFATLDDAVKAATNARNTYHGEFARNV